MHVPWILIFAAAAIVGLVALAQLVRDWIDRTIRGWPRRGMRLLAWRTSTSQPPIRIALDDKEAVHGAISGHGGSSAPPWPAKVEPVRGVEAVRPQ